MILFNKFLKVFLINQVCIWYVQGACSGSPQTITGATYTVVLQNETVVYSCTGGVEFSSGDTVIVSDCNSDGSWYPVTATCASSNPAAQNCSAPPASTDEPANATYQPNNDANTGNKFRTYVCQNNKYWLSGRPIKVMPCRKGIWMKVYDICDEGCPVPRDCADVADLGLQEEGQYLVIPSGKSDGAIQSVHCLLNNTEENHGGNWTYIFRQGKNDSNQTGASYSIGYGNEVRFNGNYFVGLNFLQDISQRFNDRLIGQIMDILFYNSSKHLKYYVTYGNFTVGISTENFKLWSVGTDHGTAGDGMCPLVNTPFELGTKTDSLFRWWGVTSANWPTIKTMKGNFLTWTLKWEPLTIKATELDFVEIRIRPIHKDRAVKCPPLFGSDVSWMETNASIPYNRSVGSVISWSCIGELYYEGQEGGIRTKNGSITCENTANGPQWSRNITLPCTVRCPDGFMLQDDGLRCFYYSTGLATGFIDASLKCQKLNSTLAVMNSSTDLVKANTSDSYFVNHALRGTTQTGLVYSLPNNTFNCTGTDKVCQVDDNNECVVVNKSLSYEYASCQASYPYICQIPSSCPFGYKLYQYTCYLVVKGVKTFQEAYTACMANGSSLAYPPDNNVATVMEGNVIRDFGLDSTKENQFFMGVNYWQASWTKGDFTMDPAYETRLHKTDAEAWRVLSINGSGSSGTTSGPTSGYISVNINYTNSNVLTHALCQYPGPIKCRNEPTNASGHMIRQWDNETYVGVTVLYRCKAGYFVQQNTSIANQNVTCLGILAEWYPSVLACERTPVCNKSLPTLGSNNTENSSSADSVYIGGNITYYCPTEMAFSNNSLSIIVYCININNTYQYDVMNIPPCNVCYDEVFAENMTSSWTNTTVYEIESAVSVSCLEGFQFLSGALNQSVNCTSSGWEWQSNETCYAMCSENILHGNASSTWANGTYTKIGSAGTLECNTGFQYLSGETTQNITCTRNGWNITNIESCVPMCIGSAEKGNAYSMWPNDTYYQIGTKMTMECKPSYEYTYGMTSQNVTCTENGWDLNNLTTCYAVCRNDPPPPGANVKPINVTSRTVGSNITYECQAGYFKPYMANGSPSKNITIRCNESAEWENPLGSDPYECTELCLDDPPDTPVNGTSDWDEIDHSVNTTVTYNCDSGYFFGNFSSTWIVTCNGLAWEPFNAPLFVCSRVCSSTPPAPQTNEESDWSAQYGKTGDNANYKCKNFTANKDGTTSYVITCQDSGSWSSRPQDFKCEPGCGGPPTAAPTGATNNFSKDYREGVVVRYDCPTNFMQYYTPTLDTTCTNGVWSLSEVPACPAQSPYKPVIPLDKNELPYQDTADFQCSDIEVCFSQAPGGNGTYKEVKGPPGFGVAAGLDGTCRVKEGGFESETEKCMMNPKNCGDKGISFSIWEKHFNYENYLNSPEQPNNTNYWYIISTGGDMKGHPGFAVYHDRHYIVAVVSTGNQFWTVDAVAQTQSRCWNNIGVVWNFTNGIKLYFNATKFGESSYPRNVTAKPALSPPNIMLGCHKTSNDSNFSGFNNASMDEFSMWLHALVDVPANQEVEKMLGGYRDYYATKSPTELSSIVSQIDYSDPAQRASAANIANLIMDQNSSSSASPTPTTGPSSTAQTPTGSDDDPEGKMFEIQVKTLVGFMDPKQLPLSIDMDAISGFMNGESMMDQLFDERNSPKWKAIQLRQEIYGASQTVEAQRIYQLELLKRVKLENGTDSACSRKPYKNIMNRACKMTMEAFLNSAAKGMVRSPLNFPLSYQTSWNLPYDVAGVFASIYSNENCQNRDVSVSYTIYDTATAVAHIGINPARLKPRAYFLDSRLFSFNVFVDQALDKNGKVDQRKPNCNPTNEDLKKSPVMYKLEHLRQELAHRTLSFHKDEINSDVAVRRCTVWNANYSDFGVWDPAGCEVVTTTAQYTKCACNRMGTYVIVGEQTEPKELKAEPKWLTILKYVLYGLSAVSLIIYMCVVAAGKDLKDQLHLMGANLALALLIGSIVIVATDFDQIKNDRHICVVVGTLLHFFYGAVGLWAMFLGYASFNAVISGVIGGRVMAYAMVCWGGALLFTGIPFVAFGLEDLGTDLRCFISWDNDPKFTFFIPQAVFSVFAMFFGIVVICNLSTSAFRKENLIDDYGSFCRGAAFLQLLIGVTWCFGFVNYVRFKFNDTDFNPIFQVLNSSSGLCLLIFIGIGSNRFRMFILGRSKRRRKFVKTYAFGLPAAVQDEDTKCLTNNGNKEH